MSQPATFFVVVATEDDWEPEIRPVAVFDTEAAAQAYADAQPTCVYPYRDQDLAALHAEYNEHLYDLVRRYNYSVAPVLLSPSGDWKPRAE